MSTTKPKDHQTKTGDGARTVTVDGIQVTVDMSTIQNDAMVLHLLSKAADGDPFAADRAIGRVLGPDQWDHVLDRLDKEHGGHIPPDVYTSFIEQLFNELNPNS